MLLRGLLLLTLSAVFCQAVSKCQNIDDDEDGDLRRLCTNITDFATVTDAISKSTTNIVHLKIEKSPELIIKRNNLDDPRLRDLQWLDINESNITNLNNSYHLQGLTKLRFLTLKHNHLTSIDQETFSGLDRLEKLYLSGNQINDIQIGAFRNLVNLTRLDLGENNITSITPDAFQGLSKLELLDLDNNFLTVIDKNMFRGLPNLLKFNLRYNQIRTVDVRAFKTNLNLEEVDFEGNQLDGLPVNLFDNTKLKFLDLEYNKLTSLSNFPLNISTLEGIDVSYNNITNIAADYFSNLPKFKFIIIGDNQLEDIPSGLFSAAPNRRFIHLANNNLTSLTVSVFSEFDEIFEELQKNGTAFDTNDVHGVFLNNNPWDCYTPDMIEVRTWCVQHNIDFDLVFDCVHNATVSDYEYIIAQSPTKSG